MMTDQELAQEVQRRLLAAEAAAAAIIADPAASRADKTAARRRAVKLARAHVWLDKAWLALQPEMGLQPLSGSPIKP